MPWVRCPPAARFNPRKVSPGFISAKNTAALADAPECGCTFANWQPNSSGHAVDRELLGDIDELAAAVIAPARIAFGIFVGQHRALRLEHGAADDILRCDQLDLVALAAEFARDRGGDFGVALAQRRGEHIAALSAGGGRSVADMLLSLDFGLSGVPERATNTSARWPPSNSTVGQ